MSANKAITTQNLKRIVHDLKTPLAAMHTAADLIAIDPLTGQQQKHLATLQTAITTLKELTHSILQSSPIEGNEPQTTEQNYSNSLTLHQQLEYTVDLFAPQLKRSNHNLVCRWSENTMNAYYTKSNELQRILSALIDNASLYSTPGTVKLSAHIKFQSDKPFVVAALSDQGPGLTSEQADQLNTSQPPKQNKNGHGLGLWSAKQLANESDGHLHITTNSSQQTCFEIVLPIQELTPPKRLETPEEPSPELIKAPLKGTILIVDDNEASRALLQTILLSFDLKVQAVQNGQSALSALSRTPFDVILLDLNMPNLSGVQTLEKIQKANFPQKPKAIFAITAGITTEEHQSLLNQGFKKILEKPITPLTLYSTLKNVLM